MIEYFDSEEDMDDRFEEIEEINFRYVDLKEERDSLYQKLEDLEEETKSTEREIEWYNDEILAMVEEYREILL